MVTVTVKRRFIADRSHQKVTTADVERAMSAATNPLDDLLAALPGLRKLRSLDQDVLRALLNRNVNECTWCAKKIGRTRVKWCSEICLKLFQSRCCTMTQRQLVKQRDAGICKICGRDTNKAEREFKNIFRDLQTSGRLPSDTEKQEEILSPLRTARGYARGHWREVDHNLPVTEGGGLCAISGLRLLCGKCHARVTDELTGRRFTLK